MGIFSVGIALADAPVNNVPGPQATTVNAALTFSTAKFNPISITHPTTGNLPVEITLGVTGGVVSLSPFIPSSPFSFTVGDGTDDALMTFSGTEGDINEALDGLVFTPAPDFVGEASLNTTSNDLGHANTIAPSTDSDTVVITVNPVADLSVTKTDAADPVPFGQNIVYTITVTNNGPSTASVVTVTDTLPLGVTFGSATPSQGTCEESPVGIVGCELGSLANGATAAISVEVMPTTTGNKTNSVTVSATEGDPDSTNNTATQETSVLGPLGLKQEAVAELLAVQALLDSTTGVGDVEDADEEIDEAIEFIANSVDSLVPGDQFHLLDDDDGEKFFHNERHAVKAIFHAVDHGEITNPSLLTELRNIIDKLHSADAMIAQVAIDDAIAAGGEPDDISDAQTEQAVALGQVTVCTLPPFPGDDSGACEDAVKSFEDAWEAAQEAVEEEDSSHGVQPEGAGSPGSGSSHGDEVEVEDEDDGDEDDENPTSSNSSGNDDEGGNFGSDSSNDDDDENPTGSNSSGNDDEESNSGGDSNNNDDDENPTGSNSLGNDDEESNSGSDSNNDDDNNDEEDDDDDDEDDEDEENDIH